MEESRKKETEELNKKILSKSKQTNVNMHPSEITNAKINIEDRKEIVKDKIDDKNDDNMFNNSIDKNIKSEDIIASITPEAEGMVSFENSQLDYKKRDDLFKKRLDMLQNTRNNVFNDNLNIPTNPLVNKSQLDVNPRDFLIKNPENPDFEAVNLPINVKSEIIHKTTNLDNKLIINPPNTHYSDISQSRTKEMDYTTENVLIINSFDRKWYSNWRTDDNDNDILDMPKDTNRYNFSIKFSTNSDESNIANVNHNFRNVKKIELIDITLSAHDNSTYLGHDFNLQDCDFSSDSDSDYDSDSSENNTIISDSSENNTIISDSSENNTIISDSSEDNTIDKDYDSCSNEEGIDNDVYLINKFDNDVDSDDNIDIDKNYNQKDIVSVPYKDENKVEKSTNHKSYTNLCLSNYPYLMLNIKEYSGKILSTNKDNTNNLSRLIFDKHIGKIQNDNNSMNGFLLLKPLLPGGNGSLIFEPTPLGILDTLTFSLLTPENQLYASENTWNIDNLRLMSIKIYKCNNSYFIDLYTNIEFHSSLYQNGDLLIIKNLEFLIYKEGKTKIKKGLNDTLHKIKNYLNRPYGLTILNTKYNSKIKTKNQLYINNFRDELDHNDFHNIITIPLENVDHNIFNLKKCKYYDVGGSIINKTIQPVITLKIECKDTRLTESNLKMDQNVYF